MTRTLMSDVVAGQHADPSIRRAIGEMKKLAPPEPNLRPRAFKMSQRSPEGLHEDVGGGRMVGHGRRLEKPVTFRSKTGLLFRCESIPRFIINVLASSCDLSNFSKGVISFPGELKYASLYNERCSTHWTPTTTLLRQAISAYGTGWVKHREGYFAQSSMADTLGIQTSPMLVLMAINPRDMPVSLGLDSREVAVEGKVRLSDIIILNGKPELFRSLIMAEDPSYEPLMEDYLDMLASLESPSTTKMLTGQ